MSENNEKNEEQRNQSSVLKGMNRTPGTINPDLSYDPNSNKENLKNEGKPKRQKGFKNQKHSIKLSGQIKNELNALKTITKTKFDYEIVELLIDNYVSNHLSTVEKRKYKVLSQDEDL